MEIRKYKVSFNTIIYLLLIAFAVAGAINKYFISGDHAFGISPEVPWGMLISGYVFFAVAATGTGFISSLGHVFGIKKFQALSKQALLASTVLLITAFGVLAVELSNPFKLVYLLITPNFTSPIFWMGFFYGLYLFLLFVELFFTIKDNHKMITRTAYVALAVKLLAVTNLGFVFSYSATRNFWHGYYYPIYMAVSAVVAGAAVLLIIHYLTKKGSGKFLIQISPETELAKSLSHILAASLVVFALMQAVNVGLSLNSANLAVAQAAKALISGPIAMSFWTMEVVIGIIIPLLILFITKFSSPKMAFGAGVLTMIGLFYSRLDFIFAGLVVPLQTTDSVTKSIYTVNVYSPTWSEWALIFGAFGFVLLVFDFVLSKFSLDA
ncbi:MAG: polysulfide reductase NrfD [Syntrophomonadaceae bacterium]|nr:polysulfide reductase NrfD [Syntrophomonadaceae bacterium]